CRCSSEHGVRSNTPTMIPLEAPRTPGGRPRKHPWYGPGLVSVGSRAKAVDFDRAACGHEIRTERRLARSQPFHMAPSNPRFTPKFLNVRIRERVLGEAEPHHVAA